MPVAKGTRIGGRQKGTPNKRTLQRERLVKQAHQLIDDVLPDAFKGDAHAYLMAVYKDKTVPIKDRLAAATAAIGYEKPKLAAVEHSGEMTVLTHEQALAELEDKANGVELHQ